MCACVGIYNNLKKVICRFVKMMGEEVYEHFRNSAVKSRKATESRMAASLIFFRYPKIYPFPPFFILTILDRIISIINYFSLN